MPVKKLFNHKIFIIMKKENQILDVFYVEELEQRFEMGWYTVSNGTTECNMLTGECYTNAQ